jgi:hypothetical protein
LPGENAGNGGGLISTVAQAATGFLFEPPMDLPRTCFLVSTLKSLLLNNDAVSASRATF